MRILQLCSKPPYPPIDGGTKAMYNITRGLLDAGHSVKVLSISTKKHPLRVADVPEEFRKQTHMEGVFVDTSLNIVDAFNDLVTSDNYNISRFFSPDMDIRLIQLLSREQFDIIHLESLFTTPYIPTIRRYSKAPIVLRSHNLEHVIQERIAINERNFVKKSYRKLLARQLKAYEYDVLARVDGVAAITQADAEHLASHQHATPMVTIPFAVKPEEYDVPPAKGPLTFFHLGSMDWHPNEEGIRWLLAKVWPRVIQKFPDARLDLAGNRMPADLKQKRMPGLKVRGRVPDANQYLATHHVMLVPLFSAGGMRVKIVEGMAMGKCIISTSMGAEGINYTDGKNILIADTAAAFVAQIGNVLADPPRVANIGQQAKLLVAKSHNVADTITDLVHFYEKLGKA